MSTTPIPAMELVTALAKAQAEMKNADLNKQNPHFKSKYADLSAVREATLPALNKHGLAITQTTEFRGEQFVLVTKLYHTSGACVESIYPLPLDVNKPQAVGSAITYARRYSWSSLCGVSSEEDDDGNAATEEGKKRTQAKDKKTSDMDWKGPLTKTNLQAAIRKLVHDMEGAADTHDLDTLLMDNADAIEQLKVDMPSWWNQTDPAKPEFIPLEHRIQLARERMGQQTNGAESYEIKPGASWDRWDAEMRDAIEGCSDIETLTKLQTDNAEHLARYQQNFAPSAAALVRAIGTKAGNLSQAPAR